MGLHDTVKTLIEDFNALVDNVNMRIEVIKDMFTEDRQSLIKTLEIIKKLEARVKELEEKYGKQEAAGQVNKEFHFRHYIHFEPINIVPTQGSNYNTRPSPEYGLGWQNQWGTASWNPPDCRTI